jgi:hypothetical protein
LADGGILHSSDILIRPENKMALFAIISVLPHRTRCLGVRSFSSVLLSGASAPESMQFGRLILAACGNELPHLPQ